MGCGSSSPSLPFPPPPPSLLPPAEALSPPMGLPLDKRKHLAGRAGVCLAWGGRVEWGGRAPWASGRRDKHNVRVGPPPALGLCLFVSSFNWEILGLQLFVSTYPMQIFDASCVCICVCVCVRVFVGGKARLGVCRLLGCHVCGRFAAVVVWGGGGGPPFLF